MIAVLLALPCGRAAVIDESDAESVRTYKWRSVPMISHGNGTRIGSYVRARINASDVYLHRFLLGADRRMQVDHIDRDGLNNIRSNLRICTPSQNSANRIGKRSASGFRGVYETKRGRWTACVQKEGVQHRLGTFDSAIDAAVAFDDAARELHGEFACLNFPALATAA